MFWLAKDDPDGAREAAQWAGRNWTQKGLIVQAYLDLLANAEIDLYQGDGLAAQTRVSERWPALKRSLLLGVQIIRINMLFLRGRAAVSAATCLPETSQERRRFLKEADRDAGRIEREDMPWSNPLAFLLRALVNACRGKLVLAATQLEAARSLFQNADMALFAAVTTRRLGEVIGGAEGKTLVCEANAKMAGMAIRSPERMTGALAPLGASHGSPS